MRVKNQETWNHENKASIYQAKCMIILCHKRNTHEDINRQINHDLNGEQMNTIRKQANGRTGAETRPGSETKTCVTISIQASISNLWWKGHLVDLPILIDRSQVLYDWTELSRIFAKVAAKCTDFTRKTLLMLTLKIPFYFFVRSMYGWYHHTHTVQLHPVIATMLIPLDPNEIKYCLA